MGKIYTVTEPRDILSPIFAEHDVRSAVLFGSCPTGQAMAVDLLVNSDLRGLAFFGLLESTVSAFDIPNNMMDVSRVGQGSPVELETERIEVQIYGQHLARESI